MVDPYGGDGSVGDKGIEDGVADITAAASGVWSRLASSATKDIFLSPLVVVGALAGFSITYVESGPSKRAKGETLPAGMLLQAVFVVSQVYYLLY